MTLPATRARPASPLPIDAGLQGHFELHLTTRLLDPKEVAMFCRTCQELACKPLIIELLQGDFKIQPMASIHHLGCYGEALDLARALQSRFEHHGLGLLRIKIEAAPHTLSSPVALVSQGGAAPYYEWHGKVDYHHPDQLRTICLQHKAHLSRNSLRNEHALRFVTLRDEINGPRIQQRINGLTQALASGGWSLHKQQLELCLLDTSPSIDNGWLPP